MAEIFCVGNGICILGWEQYLEYCRTHNLEPQYIPHPPGHVPGPRTS